MKGRKKYVLDIQTRLIVVSMPLTIVDFEGLSQRTINNYILYTIPTYIGITRIDSIVDAMSV